MIESLLTAKKTQMTEEQTKVFIICGFAEMNNNPVPDEIKDAFLFRVLAARIKQHEIDVSEWVIVFISIGLCTNPAMCTMWNHCLFKMQEKHKKRITFELLSMNDFADGFPIESEYERIWDNQKGDGPLGNLMDHPDTSTW